MTRGLSTATAGDATDALVEGERPALALVIAWSAAEPERIGEVALFTDSSARVLGRESPDEPGFVLFRSERPGARGAASPLAGAAISREQLRVRARDGALVVERIGRCPLLVAGAPVDKTVLVPGDTFQLKGQAVLLCVERPTVLPALREFPRDAWGDFGAPDALGMIGESAAIWRLREQLAFAAKASTHVLLLGPSGTGKELAARALHELSERADHPFVARSSATLPAGLIDAELFGNAKNYPNPGMIERVGLIGRADGGTLFLDEIGELPSELQAHLLRVLDRGGEYHRLGETNARTSSLCLVGATNRDPSALKHDFLARFALRLELPSLTLRREDIPLLARHLLERAAEKSASVARRFQGERGFRLDPTLIEHLIAHAYTTHARELEAMLWQAMAESAGDVIVLPPRFRAGPSSTAPDARPREERASEPSAPTIEVDAEAIRRAVGRHGGNLSRAAKELGLPSRFALYRLLKRFDLDPSDLR
jgi:two-component system nitrogen regulation response regulator GlnG/two-component system response regulator HydG